MMKPHLLLAAAGFALAACNGAGDTAAEETARELASECTTLASDPEAHEEFAKIGTDSQGFCDCFVAYVDAQAENVQQTMTLTLKEVTARMTDDEIDVDEAVGALVGELRTMDDETLAQDLQTGVEQMGGAIDEILEGFEETGTCPAT